MSDSLFSASQIAAAIRDKKLSPVEVAQSHLRRISTLNPKLNAFVRADNGEVLNQARLAAAAIERKQPLGPLHGVPLSIKCSVEVAGMPFEAGTRMRKGVTGKTDAPLVRRLRDAGAIILGVTNTPELLMAWETDNLLYGRTNNPWDVTRTAGGSSGGEAAAIASGCSAGGIGSDGGGSIRVPAHFCGVCGLKPTPGRIPATGHFPQSAGPFALLGVVGPMARTVEDLKLLFEVIQGPDDGDPSAAPVPVNWPERSDLLKRSIGFFDDDGRTPVTRETRAAVRNAADILRDSGFKVQEFRPEGLEEAQRLWWQIFGVTGGMLLGPMTAGRESELSPILREFSEWVRDEPTHTAQSLLETWLGRDFTRMSIFSQMREFPVLLCPVGAVPAFRHGEREWQIEGKQVKYLDAWSYSEWFNLLGVPAVSVPMSRSDEGLPIGVQIVARPWQEELVLSVAAELEKQRGSYPSPAI
jgi:Asp-tRNA(Asn)/Glu-tRNA(Gln) amidotransferase A subunit family amidase